MPRPTGLQGSIGTGAHLVNRWTPERVDAWLASFYGREGTERGARTAREAVDAFVAEHYAVIHCTVCGDQIVRAGEDRVRWAAKRKCAACAASGRAAGDVKYCRNCRTEFHRPETTGDARVDASNRKGWATLSTCVPCKDENRLVIARAETVAREAKAAGKRAYLDSLSPGLRRRIRHGGA